MVGGCYTIVSIGFDALSCVILIELLLVHYNAVNILIHWHLLLSREETSHSLFFDLPEPHMIPYFLHRESSLRVGVQNFGKQVLALWRHELGDLVVSTQDLLVKVGGLGILKGQVAAHHGKQHHATAPDVALQAFVLLASNHFRGCVAGRTAGCL